MSEKAPQHALHHTIALISGIGKFSKVIMMSQWHHKREDFVALVSTPEHPFYLSMTWQKVTNNMAATSKKVRDAQRCLN